MSAEQTRIADLKPMPGSRRDSKRLGKGNGSGHGTYCGKGRKGQKSRSGHKTRPWFEGGQMPIMQRLAKRGFHSPNRVVYQIVNLSELEARTSGERVDPKALKEAGLIRSAKGLIKILGDGELNRSLTVVADKFSRTAREKIAAAGGTTEERAGD